MTESFESDQFDDAAYRRKHFLPIYTNAFDRVFISVVVAVALHLLWLRLLEPAGLPLWIASIISVVLGFIIFTRG
jgi:predicted small integral membrane protein